MSTSTTGPDDASADEQRASERPTRGRRGRRLPRAQRERQMIDAAILEFSANGYHATSMEGIALRADISKPMLYSYLGSKEELFLACIRREFERMLHAMTEGIIAGKPLDTQMWQGVNLFFAHVESNRAGWRVLHQQAMSLGSFSAEVMQIRGRAIQLIGALMRDAVQAAGREVRHTAAPEPVQAGAKPGASSWDELDYDAVAAALVGAGESMADWWVDHPEQSVELMTRRFMNLTWGGLRDLVHGAVWGAAQAP